MTVGTLYVLLVQGNNGRVKDDETEIEDGEEEEEEEKVEGGEGGGTSTQHDTNIVPAEETALTQSTVRLLLLCSMYKQSPCLPVLYTF